MSITLEVGGDVYTGFVEASVTQSLADVANTFSFQASAPDGLPLPFKGQEACKVYVDGLLKLTGSIELINIDGDGDTHTITLAGRDKCGDLIDSMLGSMEDFQGVLSLKSICERVIAHLGLSIKVIDLANPGTFDAAVDVTSPDPGEFAMDFLEPLARKRQVLLSSNAEGDLEIIRAVTANPFASFSTSGAGPYLHHRVGDVENRNNVLSYGLSRDFTGRYNSYKTVSSMSVVAASLEQAQIAVLGPSAQYMSSQLTQILDTEIRKGRQHVLVDESYIPKGDTPARAQWERDIRKARGNVYGASVHGYSSQDGFHWHPNALVSVLSEYAGINDKMLVNSVTFDQSPDTRTTLALIDRDAYTLALAEPVEEEE